jgi:hypothetical protein
VSRGTIENGQGKPWLYVRTSEKDKGTILKAEVKITGPSAECVRTLTETAEIQGGGDPIMVDEFGYLDLNACPTFSVTGPKGIVEPGKNARCIFSAKPERPSRDLAFAWTVLGGKIVGPNDKDILEVRPEAVLVDEFANVFCTADLQARIDMFLVALQNTQGSTGYIVASADASIPGRQNKYFRMFQLYVQFRNFPVDRLNYYRGPDGHALHIQFWLVPQGASPPDVTLESGRKKFNISVMFDASEITGVGREIEFGGSWANEPCDLGLDLNHFAMILGADPNLDAYLLASSKSRREATQTSKALAMTANELRRTHRVPASRIKTFYVGARGENTMQLWLVPKGSEPPSFREKSVP